jgi:hypothetical protein
MIPSASFMSRNTAFQTACFISFYALNFVPTNLIVTVMTLEARSLWKCIMVKITSLSDPSYCFSKFCNAIGIVQDLSTLNLEQSSLTVIWWSHILDALLPFCSTTSFWEQNIIPRFNTGRNKTVFKVLCSCLWYIKFISISWCWSCVTKEEDLLDRPGSFYQQFYTFKKNFISLHQSDNVGQFVSW